MERENTLKCWKQYFRSLTFKNDDDEKWTGLTENSEGSDGLDFEFDPGNSRLEFARKYLFAVANDWVELDPEVREIVRPYRGAILNDIHASIEFWKNGSLKGSSKFDCVKTCQKYQAELEFVRMTL